MNDRAPDPYQRLSIFAYTVEGSAPVYRTIMGIFAAAKARFRIQLRPSELAAELERGARGELVADLLDRSDPARLERALDQLVSWGNLRRSHDTARVATLEDFRRRHFVYQITPAGEAAERAVGEVVDALSSSGSLQTVMLGAIERNLGTLADGLAEADPAPAVLYEALFNVFEQFRALAENASTFMTRLHEAIEAGEVHDEAFLAYKAAVIAYLEEFVGDLAEIAPRVAERLRVIENDRDGGVGRLTELAARADRAPTLDGVHDASAELAHQWRGLSVWFLGGRGAPPTVELLRGEARSAIHRILLALERLHEKRFRRMDRSADLLRLAGWFDAAESDPSSGDAIHRMFARAFGLFSARHLGGTESDPERAERLADTPPTASWWQAPGVAIAPALRETGRSTMRGRAAQVVDHSKARRELAARHRRRQAERDAALSRFVGAGSLRLSDLPRLDARELELLLSLLDRLFSVAPDSDGRRGASSGDGRLALKLDPPADGGQAVVRTVFGRLTLPDFALTVVDRTAGAAAGELREAAR
jgi:uncharacterized protein (TIGR02677 family)